MALQMRHLIIKEDGKVIETDIGIPMNDNIPDGVEIDFLSIDEIVDDLVNRVLSGEDKINIVKETPEQLNTLCSSLGSFIRNTYGLWLAPHPYANPRKTSAENSAENISLEIIMKVLTRLAE